jgi:predicted DNA-binding transcriptional regulator AlpA
MFVAVTGHTAMRLLSYQDLADKGISFSRQHISRLVKKKKFPAPFKPNGCERGQNAWFEHVIDQHLEACATKRKAAATA